MEGTPATPLYPGTTPFCRMEHLSLLSVYVRVTWLLVENGVFSSIHSVIMSWQAALRCFHAPLVCAANGCRPVGFAHQMKHTSRDSMKWHEIYPRPESGVRGAPRLGVFSGSNCPSNSPCIASQRLFLLPCTATTTQYYVRERVSLFE